MPSVRASVFERIEDTLYRIKVSSPINYHYLTPFDTYGLFMQVNELLFFPIEQLVVYMS